MDADKDIDLLLIGKTGNGKSATGNSILRKPKTFKAMPATESVTTDIQFDFSLFEGRTIKVVDGPGVGDTRMSDEEALKLIQDRVQFAITENPNGFHAFLLVVRYGGRFTREDIQTINCLKHIFGMDFVKNYCILIITCGDILESDVEETEMNFDQWLNAQGGYFKEMLEECNRRVILFDNKTKDETIRKEQLSRLVSMVDSLGGKRYNDEHFEKARLLRDKQLIESKEPRVREETLKETSVLLQMLNEIQLRQPEDQIADLGDIMTRANKLNKNVQDQDKGTGALIYSLEAARSIVSQTKAQLDHCEKVINDKQKFRDEQEKVHAEFASKLQTQNEEHERRMKEEKERDEQRRKEEKEATEKKWQQEKEEQAARQQQQMEALRKELENKSEQERLQAEQEFEKKIKKEAAEAEERRKKEQEAMEKKLQQQLEEAEKRRKIEEENFRRQQEEERQRRDEEERQREEERERQRKADEERHQREMAEERRRAEEAARRSRRRGRRGNCTIS